MSWTDEEIDKLFKEASEQPAFEYKASYFQAIEEQLPVKQSRKIGLWWWTANVFLFTFVGMFFIGRDELSALKLVEKTGMNTNYRFPANGNLTNAIENSKSQETGYNTLSVATEGELDSQNESNPANNLLRTTKETNSLITSENAYGHTNKKVSEYSEKSEDKSIVTEEVTSEIDRLPLLDLASGLDHSGGQIEMNSVKPKFVKNSFYIGINAGEEQAWSRDKSIDQKIHETFGVEVGYTIPLKRFTFSAGLGFQTTTLKDLKINERTKIYDFGSTMLDNSYQFNSICSITIPMELSKSFGRHNLALGITPSVNVFTHVRHYQEIDGMESLNERGVTNSSLFNRFGLSPHVSYSLSLTESIQVGLNVQVQLLQPISSQRFVGEATRMPIGAQLFLKKSINF